ncbi:hypothetical protein ACFOWZ_17950 [Lentzea rhizosphaerae]|uniref:Uncharacterized protein n=1 Tax=Lentzea rhizosphaerae TaxID=2041025 RepID=A0ABV8BVX8_9PSEU
MKRLPVPAGESSVGQLSGEGDWLASAGGESVVIWHREVAQTVEFPVSRSTPDINRHGVLISHGEDGVWRGEEKLEELPGRASTVHSINADGDVAGTSGGALAVWPAGSVSPRLLDGTDDGQQWWLGGIDDEGNVLGGYRLDVPQRHYVWNREGERTELEPLEGHYQTFATLIRDGRIYGTSAAQGDWQGTSVEWNLRGEVVRTMEGGPVFAANDAGDEALHWEGTAVRRANGRVDRLSYPFTLAFPSVLAENGDLYGGQYYEGPAKVFCR